ncbi:malectin-A-like [Tubulanus polymorphus]|uniref:malectin-A-like n=1 Tax=Tubulanus polymorphus TaxID=672921 RepID=UPI003DA4F2F8
MFTGKTLFYKISIFLVSSLFVFADVSGLGEVIWAVNTGGDAHTDIHGIRYQKDMLTAGIPSDYGRNLVIQRVVPQDQVLYQTERYHTQTFGYDIPIKQDGDYVLWLKFCEVWFTAVRQKVFDVVVNGQHTVVEGLDIYSQVGRGTAHDEIIPFSVKNGKLKIMGETSSLKNGQIRVDFVKGDLDNPKINALIVMKGSVDDVPKLPPIPGMVKPPSEEEDEEDKEEKVEEKAKENRNRRTSGPAVADPYAGDDTSSMMLPLFIAVGAFIPLVFCLCKL